MRTAFSLVRPNQHGIAVGAEIGLQALCSLTSTSVAGANHLFKHQLHTTHAYVGAVGSEPDGSSPRDVLADKVDQP